MWSCRKARCRSWKTPRSSGCSRWGARVRFADPGFFVLRTGLGVNGGRVMAADRSRLQRSMAWAARTWGLRPRLVWVAPSVRGRWFEECTVCRMHGLKSARWCEECPVLQECPWKSARCCKSARCEECPVTRVPDAKSVRCRECPVESARCEECPVPRVPDSKSVRCRECLMQECPVPRVPDARVPCVKGVGTRRVGGRVG